MITVSGKCVCAKCEARTSDVYRMVGWCRNCLVGPVLMIFRAGDPVVALDCPECGCWHTVIAKRRATDDEIPEAVAS